MAEHDINFRWCRWAFEGKGKEHGGGPRDNHWYHGNVRYCRDRPVQRWVRAPRRGNKLILLVSNLTPACDDMTSGSRNTLVTNPGYSHRHDRVQVEDLGVFSRFPDDMLPDDQLHDRVRFIMINRVRHFVLDIVSGMTGDMLTTSEVSKLRTKLDIWIDRYDVYSRLFALDWDGFPSMYYHRFEDMVDEKVRAYNDPDAKRKRERAAARRMAVRALDLQAYNRTRK